MQVSALDRVAQTREKCLGPEKKGSVGGVEPEIWQPKTRWSSKYANDDEPLDLRVILDKTSLRPHCDLTGIMANKGNHHQMALFQVSELL